MTKNSNQGGPALTPITQMDNEIPVRQTQEAFWACGGVTSDRERPGESGTAPSVQSTDVGAKPTLEGGGGDRRKARTRKRERERGGGSPHERRRKKWREVHAREKARGGARPMREKKSGIRAHGDAPEGSV